MSQRVAAGGEAKVEPSRSEGESEQGDSSRRPRTRSRASHPGAGRSGGETPWRPAPTSVEKGGDDPGVGVKGQTSPEISRSPRNSFRAGPRGEPAGGRATGSPRGRRSLPKGTELRTQAGQGRGVRTRELSSAPEREPAPTARQGPTVAAEWPRMSGRADSQDVGPDEKHPGRGVKQRLKPCARKQSEHPLRCDGVPIEE